MINVFYIKEITSLKFWNPLILFNRESDNLKWDQSNLIIQKKLRYIKIHQQWWPESTIRSYNVSDLANTWFRSTLPYKPKERAYSNWFLDIWLRFCYVSVIWDFLKSKSLIKKGSSCIFQLKSELHFSARNVQLNRITLFFELQFHFSEVNET
jgi:hypothetical protein